MWMIINLETGEITKTGFDSQYSALEYIWTDLGDEEHWGVMPEGDI